MSTTALYKALTEAGVSEDSAERAVEGLVHAGEAATKTDLAALEVRLIKWIVTTAIAATGVVIVAVGLIVKF